MEIVFPVIQDTNTYYTLVSSCGLEVNHSSFVTQWNTVTFSNSQSICEYYLIQYLCLFVELKEIYFYKTDLHHLQKDENQRYLSNSENHLHVINRSPRDSTTYIAFSGYCIINSYNLLSVTEIGNKPVFSNASNTILL